MLLSGLPVATKLDLCSVNALVHILVKLLDSTNGGADLNIDVTIKHLAKPRIVGDHTAVVHHTVCPLEGTRAPLQLDPVPDDTGDYTLVQGQANQTS